MDEGLAIGDWRLEIGDWRLEIKVKEKYDKVDKQ